MAGRQQFYFFPTDFLDTINKDHPSSLPLDHANKDRNMEDNVKHVEKVVVLRGSAESKIKNLKISMLVLPLRVLDILFDFFCF
ncbi:hypothetical protein CTI12_AA526600 [Artemisia annua]|uniref:Uncharacterized protein n=1 Tax=Artemisia annua TaxID=35608 RepID=A0A2U1L110_ARTAN|nr:hypothetical protein CTI12_AA526600 [Artemisia annua]